MGQSSSRNRNSSPEHIIPETVCVIQDEVMRQARILTEIATLSYDEFILCLEQLNELSRKVTDHNGKQLLFAVKKGTDSTVLWKGTVKIACVKIDPITKEIECHRLFNLNQFMKIFKTLECQLTAALQSSQKEKLKKSEDLAQRSPKPRSSYAYESSECDSSDDSSYHESVSDNSSDSMENEREALRQKKREEKEARKQLPKVPKNLDLKSDNMKKFTASMLLEEVDNLASAFTPGSDKLGECCICLERKPDMVLPCAHAYCMPCIEQWNTWHKTCPFCRETLDNTDDTWIISDIPGSQEISDEISSSLMELPSPE